MPAAQLRLAQSLLGHALGVSRQLDAEQPNLNIARDLPGQALILPCKQ